MEKKKTERTEKAKPLVYTKESKLEKSLKLGNDESIAKAIQTILKKDHLS